MKKLDVLNSKSNKFTAVRKQGVEYGSAYSYSLHNQLINMPIGVIVLGRYFHTNERTSLSAKDMVEISNLMVEIQELIEVHEAI